MLENLKTTAHVSSLSLYREQWLLQMWRLSIIADIEQNLARALAFVLVKSVSCRPLTQASKYKQQQFTFAPKYTAHK